MKLLVWLGTALQPSRVGAAPHPPSWKKGKFARLRGSGSSASPANPKQVPYVDAIRSGQPVWASAATMQSQRRIDVSVTPENTAAGGLGVTTEPRGATIVTGRKQPAEKGMLGGRSCRRAAMVAEARTP